MRSVSILVVFALLTSCSSPLAVTLYNNSNSELRVTSLGVDILVAPNSSETFEVIGGFIVSHVGHDLHYARPFVPGEYYGRYKLFRHKILVQFESNGDLLLVKPEQKFPIASELSQPDGFPLRPEKMQPNNALHLQRWLPSRGLQTQPSRRKVGFKLA